MPYKIQGRILASDGYPTGNGDVLIQEIAPSPASAWADPETGEFIFMASSENALVKVSSNFYKPKTVLAKFLQGDTMLEDDGVLVEAKRPTSSALWWTLGIIAAIGIASVAGEKTIKARERKAAGGKATPAAAKKPKEVVV